MSEALSHPTGDEFSSMPPIPKDVALAKVLKEGQHNIPQCD
jgi:hypothetical protein